MRAKYFQQGPFVYELYGVMIHSGGAYGGHYSAYIKDTEGIDDSEFKDRTESQINQIKEDRWYHFNDSHVRKISITQLADAFGRRAIAANQASAYMLMYRLIDSQTGVSKLQIPLDEISEDLQQEVMESLQGQQVRTAAVISDRAKMQLKVVHVKSSGNDDEFEILGQPKVFMVDRTVDTYTSLKKMALEDFFGTDGNVVPDQYRLRAFNVQFSIMMDTYEGREDLTLELLKIYPMKITRLTV